MESGGQRQPMGRHRPKDQYHENEGFPLQSSDPRQHEHPPLPRRQWNPEDPSTKSDQLDKVLNLNTSE